MFTQGGFPDIHPQLAQILDLTHKGSCTIYYSLCQTNLEDETLNDAVVTLQMGNVLFASVLCVFATLPIHLRQFFLSLPV